MITEHACMPHGQARKGAAIAGTLCAGVWRVGPPPFQGPEKLILVLHLLASILISLSPAYLVRSALCDLQLPVAWR